MDNIRLFLLSVFDHHLSWIGGILTCIGVVELIFGKKIFVAPKWVVLAGVVLLFISCYQAWFEEHAKVMEEAVYLIGENPVFVLGKDSPVTLPINTPPQLNVTWKTFSQHPSPAKNARQISHCYIENGIDDKSKDNVINEFADWWADILKKFPKYEGPTIFPGDGRLSTCSSDITVTQGIRDSIANQTKFLYVIGAARFEDGLGEHEAHICKILEAQTVGPNIIGSWHDCNRYINQADEKK